MDVDPIQKRVTFLLNANKNAHHNHDHDNDNFFEQLDQSLESPKVIYYNFTSDDEEGDENQVVGDNNYYFLSCCVWGQQRYKMWCGPRLCCLFLLIKCVLLLGIIFPMVHLQETHNGRQNHNYNHNSYDDMLNGYPNSGDNNNRNGNGLDQHGDETSVTPVPGNDDDIIVVRHENEPMTSPSTTTTGDTDSAKDAIDNNTKQSKECSPKSQQDSPNAVLESKLESIISAISNIHQSIEKMETLMQGTLMDDQKSKCISAIHLRNITLALKHWTQILKYQSNQDAQFTALSILIKEAYNGDPDHILPLGDFISATSLCSGFSTLYSEMNNYGHIFGGHPYIFPLAVKIHKSCPDDPDLIKLLPSTINDMLEGSFTLQNKGNRGYLYYAKRCVAKHYYNCLDVLTKRLPTDEFAALEEKGDEWRRYRWRINSTTNTNYYFYILNEDKYLPYRLQDLNNSPRFKMEEASSSFEMDMGYFQIGLQNENEVVIQVRDTEMFLEGEEIKVENGAEVLLHSYHKTDNQSPDRIRWIVNNNEDDNKKEPEGKVRLGRSSSSLRTTQLKFPLLYI